MQGKETAARSGFVKRMIEDINKRENKRTPKKNIKKTISYKEDKENTEETNPAEEQKDEICTSYD